MNRNEAEELLPWFVAGTLSEDESRAVQAFIDSGEISQQELRELEVFAETVTEQSEEEPVYNTQILQNALSQLDGIVQDEPLESLIVGETVVGKQGLMSRLIGGFQWDRTPLFARLAMGAQFALVVALGMLLFSPEPTPLTDQGYRTVAGTISPAHLKIAFAPGVTEVQMRELLLGVNATIASGPNSLGMYSILIGPAGDSTQSKDIDVVSKVLNDSPWTTYVQPAVRPQ